MNKKYIKLSEIFLLGLVLLQSISVQAVEQSEAFKKRLAAFQPPAEQPKEKLARPVGQPSGAAVFKEKLAIAQLETALRDLNLNEVKRIINANKHLVNSKQLEPLRKVIMVVSDRQAAQQKEVFDYLLSVDGIDVNLTSDQGENALDIAVKNIKVLRTEKSKDRYRAMARQLIDQGAQLSALAGDDAAQAIVNELQPQKVQAEPVVRPVEEKPVAPEKVAQVLQERVSAQEGAEMLGAGSADRVSQGAGAGVEQIYQASQAAGRVGAEGGLSGAGRPEGRSELDGSSGRMQSDSQAPAAQEQAALQPAGSQSLDLAAKQDVSAQQEVVQGVADRPAQEAKTRAEIAAERDDESMADEEGLKRAELSNKITKYTQQFAKLDDQIRDLESQQRKEENELRDLAEKIQQGEAKIKNLHKKREELTNKLAG